MAAGRHFVKRKITITQPLFQTDIFTKFGLLVAVVILQRGVMSFLDYTKIQDGGWPPF